MSVADELAGLARQIGGVSLFLAQRYLMEEKFEDSLRNFINFGQATPAALRESHSEEFIFCVKAVGLILESEKRWAEVAQMYTNAMSVLPNCPKLITNYGSHLFRQGKFQEAESEFKRALSIQNDFVLARERLDNLYSALLDRWHFPMLNDAERNTKYHEAIQRAMLDLSARADDIQVLDVGSGTGLLTLYACDASPKAFVHACETSEILCSIARKVFKANKPQLHTSETRVRLLQKHSLELSVELDNLPEEPFHILITEIFDAGLLGEQVLASVHGAWKSGLLKKSTVEGPLVINSRVLPGSAEFVVAPIECEYIANYTLNTSNRYGYLDLSKIKVFSSNSHQSSKEREPYTSEKLCKIPSGFSVLSPPKVLFYVDFNNPDQVEALLMNENIYNVTFPADRTGQCHAIAGWFQLHLDETAVISTIPSNLTSCWEQAVFPVHSNDLKVTKDVSKINAMFSVKGFVQLVDVEVRRKEIRSVALTPKMKRKNWIMERKRKLLDSLPVEQLLLPPDCIKHLNGTHNNIHRAIATHAAFTMRCKHLLDISGSLPLTCLQIMALVPEAKLTIAANMENKERLEGIMEFVEAVCRYNNVNLTNIGCVTGPPSLVGDDEAAQSGGYSVVVTSPVTDEGRLNDWVLLSLKQIRESLAFQGNFLPIKLQVWCQVVESFELATMAGLVDNRPVHGFSIAEHINQLASRHLQDVHMSTISKNNLTGAVRVLDIGLADRPSERISTTPVIISSEGVMNAIFYWFKLDYGRGLITNTSEDPTYKQAVFMIKPTMLYQGDRILLITKIQDGLLSITVENVPSQY